MTNANHKHILKPVKKTKQKNNHFSLYFVLKVVLFYQRFLFNESNMKYPVPMTTTYKIVVILVIFVIKAKLEAFMIVEFHGCGLMKRPAYLPDIYCDLNKMQCYLSN